MKLLKYSLLCAFVLVSSELYAQNSQSINYQQRFKDAIAQLDTCQECALKQLLEIKAAQYAPEITRINSTIVLANISVNSGNIESLDVFLKDIEQYLAQHPDDKDVSATLKRLKDNRSELSKLQETFRDRLIGTWVTAEANDDALPIKVIVIRKSDNGELTSIFYNYLGRKNPPTETKNIDIDGTNKMIGIHIGTDKEKKADTEFAQSLMASVRQNAQESAATKARTGHSDWSKDFGNIFLTLMAKDAAVSSTTHNLAEYFLKELTPDILYGKYFCEYWWERSDGKEEKTYTRVRELYLYRITPEDSITFACKDGYWITRLNKHFVDYKTIKKSIKMSLEENNINAYSKLRAKIIKNVGNLDEVHAEWVTGELEYGPYGYSWNDGYYVANEEDAINNKYSYDEQYKGPYSRDDYWWGASWDMTIHDYWKTFDRKDSYKEHFDFEKRFRGSGVSKYFNMRSEKDAKKDKKKKGKKEVEE